MRFALSDDQRDFATTLDSLLTSSDPAAVARAWAAGDTAPGLKLWSRLAELGLSALVVPESAGGTGAGPVELVVAFEQLGRHAVPGPWVETAAYLPLALADTEDLAALAAGRVATVAVAPHTPYALDADVAERVYVVSTTGAPSVAAATAGDQHRSVDRTRRLFDVVSTSSTNETAPANETALPDETAPANETAPGELARAFDLAALATAAQLLGCGERLLADSVAYVKQRRQFGREIGSYQAIKHRLADVRIALDFARPLLWGAAVGTPDSSGLRARDVSAAKVACGDAAYLASRAALQVHGAVGYTQELDLSLWITKVRALVSAWGTPAFHRGRVLDGLVSTGSTHEVSCSTSEVGCSTHEVG